jgi:hypothetical protein
MSSNIDPAKQRHTEISTSELAALRQMPSTLWIAADRIASASLHRGRINDRLLIKMTDGSRRKLLWVRDGPATAQVEKTLRLWLGDRLLLD